jgi:predicted transcriptional regulator
MNQQIKELDVMGMESVTTYVPSETKRKLEEWAKEEERSISYLVAKLITEAVSSKDEPTSSKKTKGAV